MICAQEDLSQQWHVKTWTVYRIWWSLIEVRLIAAEYRSHGPVPDILVALYAKSVQKNLTSEQKENFKSACVNSSTMLKMS
jgi:hypothetical protein